MTDSAARLAVHVFGAAQAGMTGDESDAEVQAWCDLLPPDERDLIIRAGLDHLMRAWMGSLLPSRRSSLQRAGPQAVADAFVADLVSARVRRPS